jgi:hypothetical protein
MPELTLLLAVRIYGKMRENEVAEFFAPDAHPWDTEKAVAFLESMVIALKKSKDEYPDGLPF